jgi:histidinol-phosphate aminotransferase
MNTISISRRRFAQLLTVGAAAAVVKPALSLAKTTEPAASPPAAALAKAGSASTGIIRLSANENPYGPSPKALKAMTESFGLSNRYPDEHADQLVEALAKLNAVNPDQILLGDGSGEILDLCAETFTGPAKGKLVAADPTFEAILKNAEVGGAEVVKIPLTSTFAHDLPQMAAAAKDGLIYVCNPNNPTASITPKNELHDFIEKTSPSTMILVDEAYFHYADSSEFESVIPLIKDHPNLMVARTFSKIYGMAGLRCGYCVAQKETIAKLRSHQPWDSVNCMALAAAVASVNDADQVKNACHLNAEAKSFILTELNKMGYQSIPSQANFIMFDCKRPVVPIIQAMKQHKVQVGRLFPSLPNHMRLTIGKRSEMESFLSAFRQIAV